MTATNEAPVFVTTIDQHTGDHDSGTPYYELRDIVTSFADLCPGLDWDAFTPQEREEYRDAVADIHAAEVEKAELPADHRARADEHLAWLTTDGGVQIDFDNTASVIRQAIADTVEG